MSKRFASLYLLFLYIVVTASYAESTPTYFPAYQIHPPIALYASWLHEEPLRDCELMNSNDVEESHCQTDIVSITEFETLLRESNQFSSIDAAKEGIDYEILFASAAFSHPSTMVEYVSQIQVSWRGIVINQFEYRQRTHGDSKTGAADFAVHVTERLLADIKQEKSFEPQSLYKLLEASDYPTELVAPNEVYGFKLKGKQLYADPLKGVMLRYTNPAYHDDFFDVFIYPISQPYWNNHNVLLKQELDKEIDDIHAVASLRQISLDTQTEVHPISWQAHNRQFSGYRLTMDATNSVSEQLYNSTYVFIAKDKIVKFSANFPSTLAEPLVKETLPSMTVPGESKLMEGLRRHLGS